MKKTLNVLVVILIMLFVSVVNVRAGELDADFQKIAPDGVFTINFRKPKNAQELFDFSFTYINEKYKDYSGFISDCDETYTNCLLQIDYIENNNNRIHDSKEVKVIWNEEYSDLFKKVLAEDNILKVNFRKPKDINEASDYVRSYLVNQFGYDLSGYLRNCNADYTECILNISDMTKEETNGNMTITYSESNVVNIEWNEVYSEDFKKIAPNNVVIVKNMEPSGDHNNYSTSYFDKLYPNVRGTFNNCNADYSVCDLALYRSYSGVYDEVHQVKVIWKEETSEFYNSIAPNGVFNIKSVKPQNADDLELYSVSAINQTFKNAMGYLYDCNKDYTECILSISDTSNTDDSYFQDSEEHRVKVVWEKENPLVKKLVDAAVKAVKLGQKEVHTYVDEITSEKSETTEYYHILEDLNLINLLKNTKNNDYNNSINFVPELKLLFDNTNITYNLDTRLGDGYYFYEMGGGQLSLLYKGVVYALVNPYGDIVSSYTSVYRNYVLYIPSNTENTKEAYLTAVKKRLDEYLKEDVKVEVGGLLKDYLKGDKLEIPFFNAKEDQIGDYYYKITINGKTYDFLVVRDTSKMVVNNLLKSIDVDTNVKVETNASDVPNDAIINVKTITKENTEYNKIMDIIKTDVFQAFDINLYSETFNGNITKTEKGEFKITLPVADNLKGKNLVVYYIKDDGSLEEHPVTLDEEGNATFTTNHFSTYILAEALKVEDNSNNVQTSTINPIITNIVMLSSLVGMIIIGRNIKRRIEN